MISWSKNNTHKAPAGKHFDAARQYWVERFEGIRKMAGPENPYQIGRELGDVMTENVTVVRHNDKLKNTLSRLREMKDRWARCNVLDTSNNANRSLSYLRETSLSQ